MIDQVKILQEAAISQLIKVEEQLSKLPSGQQKDYVSSVVDKLKNGESVDIMNFIQQVKKLSNA